MNYLVHNTAKSPATKPARLAAGVRGGSSLYIPGGARVLPNRPIQVDEGYLRTNLEALLSLTKSGQIAVTTLQRQKVDLVTMTADPLPPTQPEPEFPQDSLARDGLPTELEAPQYVHEEPIPKQFEMPVAAPPAALDPKNPFAPPPATEEEVDVTAPVETDMGVGGDNHLDLSSEETAMPDLAAAAPAEPKKAFGKKNK